MILQLSRFCSLRSLSLPFAAPSHPSDCFSIFGASQVSFHGSSVPSFEQLFEVVVVVIAMVSVAEIILKAGLLVLVDFVWLVVNWFSYMLVDSLLVY